MIPQVAVQEFLTRPRDSHLWVKELSKKELWEAVNSLRPRPRLFEGLHTHQLACFLLGIAYPQFAFWLDMGCVDGETEYLTPLGWKKIRDYCGGLVAQYNPHTRAAEFVFPRRFINEPQDEFLYFKSARGCDQMLTPEHNMLVVAGGVDPNNAKSTNGSVWKHTPVCIMPEYQSDGYGKNPPWFFRVAAEEPVLARVETTFLYNGPGLVLSDAQIRVQVAVHADGYLVNKSKVVIRVKKERKKERLRSLLAAAGIDYIERPCAPEGFSFFRFIPPMHTKTYGSTWYNASLLQKQVICDEVGYWDGSFTNSGGINFYSNSRECADFIQFCFSSTRRRAFVTTNVLGESIVHAIGTGRTTNLAHLPRPVRVFVDGGRKYCFEVDTGFLVLRRNGNVFVTGNTGKTVITLSLLRYWHDCGMLRRALIFITSDKAFPTWEKQMHWFDTGLPYVFLDGSSRDKWYKWEEFGDGLMFVSYPGATALVTKTVKEKGKKKTWWELDNKLVVQLSQHLDALVLDESTRASGYQSLTHKLIDKLGNAASIRYALAGRPFGRDPTLLWAQHKLIDRGDTLGTTLGLFRAAFFTSKENPWVPQRQRKYALEYTFDKRKTDLLSRLVQHRSITYSEAECIDVPKFISIISDVEFSQEARAYYREAVSSIVASKGNKREIKNIFVRMRQMASGFLGFKDDETGERAEVAFEENPKLEVMLDLVYQLPTDRKAIIFYEFTWSGRRLYEELEKLGLKPVWLWSGTKNPQGDLKRFEFRDSRVMVLNNRVGAYSLDGLQVANYCFFYESPLSCIDREQAERRLRRQGQKRRVYQYDLVVKDSVEEKILQYHAVGRDLHKAVLADPSVLLEKLR